MRLYVAGKFKSFRKVRKVIDTVKDLGHTVTHDWTRTNEFDEHGEPIPYPDFSDAELQAFAEADLQGVRECEAVLVCADDPDLCGAYIEVGAALLERKQVFVVAHQRWTVFYRLPNVHLFDTYDAFFDYLRRTP